MLPKIIRSGFDYSNERKFEVKFCSKFKFPAKKLRKIRAPKDTHAPTFFFLFSATNILSKIFNFPAKKLRKNTVPKIRMRRFFLKKKIKGKKNLSVVVSLSSFIVLQSINKITKQYLLAVFASFIIFQQ